MAYWHVVKSSVGRKPIADSKVQFVRSLVVSVVALCFDFSILVILKELLHVNYLIAATFGFLVGVCVNYFLSVTWVFTHRQLDSRAKEMTFFLAICATGLLLNLAIIAVLVRGITLDYRIAKVFSTVVVFFWNFVARKKYLY